MIMQASSCVASPMYVVVGMLKLVETLPLREIKVSANIYHYPSTSHWDISAKIPTFRVIGLWKSVGLILLGTPMCNQKWTSINELNRRNIFLLEPSWDKGWPTLPMKLASSKSAVTLEQHPRYQFIKIVKPHSVYWVCFHCPVYSQSMYHKTYQIHGNTVYILSVKQNGTYVYKNIDVGNTLKHKKCFLSANSDIENV